MRGDLAGIALFGGGTVLFMFTLWWESDVIRGASHERPDRPADDPTRDREFHLLWQTCTLIEWLSVAGAVCMLTGLLVFMFA